VQFVDPAEVATPGQYRVRNALPVPGDGSLAGGCGAEGALTASSLAAPDETLVYGRAPREAESVDVELPDGSRHAAQLYDGRIGATAQYYAVSVHGRQLAGLKAQARDADGRIVQVADVPGPER